MDIVRQKTLNINMAYTTCTSVMFLVVNTPCQTAV